MKTHPANNPKNNLHPPHRHSEQAKRVKSKPRNYTRGSNDSRIEPRRPSLTHNPIK